MLNVLPNSEFVQLAPAAARTATFSTNLIDCSNGHSSVAALIHVGADTGTLDASNYLTPAWQESDTTADADFVDVPADRVLRAFPVINAKATYENKTIAGECIPAKKYVRVKLTETGTVNAVIGATGIVADLRSAPAVYAGNILGTGAAST